MTVCYQILVPFCNEAVLDFTLQWTDVCPDSIKFLSFICSKSQGDKAQKKKKKKKTIEIELSAIS